MIKNIEFVDKLRSSGLRPTKQRLKICEVLFNTEKTFHFTINDLAKNISEKLNEKISLATVYNTIHAFKDPFLKVPLLSLISVILSNISIGGSGNFAFPDPKSLPFPQFIKSSYE